DHERQDHLPVLRLLVVTAAQVSYAPDEVRVVPELVTTHVAALLPDSSGLVGAVGGPRVVAASGNIARRSGSRWSSRPSRCCGRKASKPGPKARHPKHVHLRACSTPPSALYGSAGIGQDDVIEDPGDRCD